MARIEVYKYGILGMYVADLQQLQNGTIPHGFEFLAGVLREALPLFPDNERPNYEAILEAGSSQVQFLRATQIGNALQDAEKSRIKVIDDFLAEV